MDRVSHIRVFYDSQCDVCSGLRKWVGFLDRKRSIEWTPLQTKWALRQAGIDEAEASETVHALTPQGVVKGARVAAVVLDALLPARAKFFEAVVSTKWLGGLAEAGFQLLSKNRFRFGTTCSIS